MGVILWEVSPLYVNPVIVVMAGATFLFIKLKCDRSVKNRPFLFGSFFQSLIESTKASGFALFLLPEGFFQRLAKV